MSTKLLLVGVATSPPTTLFSSEVVVGPAERRAMVRPLQLVYMFLVRRLPCSRPPSVNVLCIARMTWMGLYLIEQRSTAHAQ